MVIVYMKYSLILIIITLLTGIAVLNYQLKSSNSLNKVLFNILALVFLGIFTYYGYNHGTIYGLGLSLFLWAFFVCSVPIPQVALLLSFPLKHFFNISITISQFLISIFAMIIILYVYCCNLTILRSHHIGKIFKMIIRKKLFLIFIISIIASILGSYLIDGFVEKYIYKETMQTTREKHILLAVMLFLLLNVWYLNYTAEHKIYI